MAKFYLLGDGDPEVVDVDLDTGDVIRKGLIWGANTLVGEDVVYVGTSKLGAAFVFDTDLAIVSKLEMEPSKALELALALSRRR